MTLAESFEWHFSSVKPLKIISVQPADGSGGAPLDTIVTIFFDQPIVTLNAIEDAANLPDPLIFEPPVAGRGEWLDTSTYQFIPDSTGFRRAATYTVRVEQGLTDVTGEAVLVADFEWHFSTIAPTPTPAPTSTPTPAPLNVTHSEPQANAKDVNPATSISLGFNRPMHRQNVQEKFRLFDVQTEAVISGKSTLNCTTCRSTPLSISAKMRASLLV